MKWAWWRQRFDIKWMAHDGLDSLSETAWAIPCSSVCGCSPFPDDALVQLKQNGLAWCCQCLSHAAGKSYISHFFAFVSLGLIRGRLSRRLTWKELLKVLSTRQDPDSCASHRSALSGLCILVRSFWGDGAEGGGEHLTGVSFPYAEIRLLGSPRRMLQSPLLVIPKHMLRLYGSHV